MQDFELPFVIEVPIVMGNLKYVFFVTDRIYATGPRCVSTPHNHSNYEIRYTVAGSGTQIVGEENFPTQTGDVLLVHPMEYHCQGEGAYSPDLARYSLAFSVKAPSEKAPLAQKKSYESLIKSLQTIRLLKDENMTLLPYFLAITKAVSDKKYGYFNHLQALCIQLFTDFISLTTIRDTAIFPSATLTYSNYWVKQLEFFLGSRYMENIKLPDLAAFLRVSNRQASRIVRQEYGVSYTTMLTEFRVQKAKYLLLQSAEKELGQVGSKCGFQSYTYFITCFRKVVGMTPADYREKHLSNGSAAQ